MFNSSKPVLSDRTIKKYIEKGLLIDSKTNTIDFKNQLQPNSFDLTLGSTTKILVPNSAVNEETLNSNLPGSYIDSAKKIEYQSSDFIHNENGSDYFIIYPHQFVLMASREILNIPNGIVAFVQGRSSIARLGIQTEQAGLIDAGFKGTITFEVFNESSFPIVLYYGMRVAQVYFFKAQHSSRLYNDKHRNSKYQNQFVSTGSLIYKDPELVHGICNGTYTHADVNCGSLCEGNVLHENNHIEGLSFPDQEYHHMIWEVDADESNDSKSHDHDNVNS